MSFTKEEYAKIGKAIKRELEDRGLSQKRLAGVTQRDKESGYVQNKLF